MGAVVLGPAAKVEHASMHTEAAEAAILDVNLNGRRVFPIADELMRRGVPFVFFSGDEDIVIPERLRHASNLRKSSDSYAVFDALFPLEDRPWREALCFWGTWRLPPAGSSERWSAPSARSTGGGPACRPKTG